MKHEQKEKTNKIPPATEDDLKLDLDRWYGESHLLTDSLIRLAHHYEQEAERRGRGLKQLIDQDDQTIRTLEAALRKAKIAMESAWHQLEPGDSHIGMQFIPRNDMTREIEAIARTLTQTKDVIEGEVIPGWEDKFVDYKARCKELEAALREQVEVAVAHMKDKQNTDGHRAGALGIAAELEAVMNRALTQTEEKP